jgi:selenocysteine lyase/cysteine desulfurase
LTRKALAEFFGAPSPDRVIFTKNCTEALNIAILGTFKEGDKVISTVAEHNSVLRPLNYLKGKGVRVEFAPLTDGGEINVTKLIEMVDESTRAVVITLASNVTGTAPNLHRLRAEIPQSTLLICDGAQACGHDVINIGELGIDALAVAGHKGMLGIQGSGALIMSERFNPSPITFGGTGSESYNLNMPSFYPDCLESGTLSYPAIISLGEGVNYLKTRLYENKDRTKYLSDLLINGLAHISKVRLYSKANAYGIVAFEVCGLQSELVAWKLSEEFSVCVRGGLHCAPLIHKALGSEGLVRASLSAFNTESEIDFFLRAIEILSKR